jgi:sec-independent protein translocase protein TatB
MFDLDAGKILVVGVVALLVIGPKDLPRVLRTVGSTVGKMRRMASEFQNQFMEAIKEADLEDVKKEFSAIRDSANIDTSFDAASIMREEITTAVDGPRDVGHSTIDLTGTGPMKEIAAGPVDAAPQQLGSLVPAEPHDASKPAEDVSADPTGTAPVREAVASDPVVKEAEEQLHRENETAVPADAPVPHGGQG